MSWLLRMLLFDDLSRLMDVLEFGLDEEINFGLRKPGPRVNLGLGIIATQVSQFFKDELNGRPFTIDILCLAEASDHMDALPPGGIPAPPWRPSCLARDHFLPVRRPQIRAVQS